MAEATGSSPVSSTPQTPSAPHRESALMISAVSSAGTAQQAAAGPRILVTRRGKPYVRLLPAHAQLPITD